MRLAYGAPVGDPVGLSLAPARDRRATARARAAGPPIDATRGPGPLQRRLHEPCRDADHGLKVPVRRLGEPQPRREPRLPERLGPPEVPDACDQPLVEERLPELSCLVGLTKAAQHRGEVQRLGEDVGTEAPGRAVGELEHRAATQHRLVLASPQHEPGQTVHLGAARNHAPAPGHAQVAPKDDPAAEAQQEVLTVCLHALEDTSVQALGDACRSCPGVTRLDLEPLADEHLQAAGRTVQGIAFGHVGNNRLVGRVRSAAAGALAAAVWAAQEPLDQRVVGYDYSDVALLGKAVTRGPAWRSVGLGIHMANGALFGLVYHEARTRLRVDPMRLALGMATAERLALFSLGALVDRYHPARGEPGLPPIFTKRAFVQATWRHGLFGWTLGRLAG